MYCHLSTGVYYVHQHWKVGLKSENQLQFKYNSEQITFWKFTLISKVKLWKYVETMQHKMEKQ
jgi:hypothetical protein